MFAQLSKCNIKKIAKNISPNIHIARGRFSGNLCSYPHFLIRNFHDCQSYSTLTTLFRVLSVDILKYLWLIVSNTINVGIVF